MIVVVGSLRFRPADGTDPDAASGPAAAIARTAARAGASVQVVGKIGDDGAGDSIVVSLGRERVGHAALLRDPAHPTPIETAVRGTADAPADEDVLSDAETESAVSARNDGILPADPAERPALEPADLELALRYLTDASVIVSAEPVEPPVAAAIAAAASWANAGLVAVVDPARPVPEAFADATVFAAPADDPEEAFAAVVGTYAAALDAGREPGDAFRAALASAGWEAAGTDTTA